MTATWKFGYVDGSSRTYREERMFGIHFLFTPDSWIPIVATIELGSIVTPLEEAYVREQERKHPTPLQQLEAKLREATAERKRQALLSQRADDAYNEAVNKEQAIEAEIDAEEDERNGL